MLRAYKTPIFAKGQKLTHSPAHVEKHAGQETPLLYTPYLQWHHPGGRAVGMQVRIRTNSLEFEFAPNSHEFVDRSELEFATSNSNPP